MKKKNTDINDLYAQDPIAADRTIWGRETSRFSRRGFLKKSGLITMSAALGMTIPFARLMPAGLIPAAFAADNAPSAIPGKDGLIILNDRPMNAETPAHLLNDDVTPNSRMFIRNNGLPPENINSETWQLEITGESCERPRSFSIAELRERF